MMVQCIYKSVQRAKKRYRDDMWEQFSEWVHGGMYVEKFRKNPSLRIPFSDLRIICRLRNDPNARFIMLGQKYERQFNSHSGDTYVFRAKVEFVDLQKKYQFAEWDY